MGIRQLPPSVINKIAAGEVIERPASVVKELVENSLDAGATRIEVSVEQGGTELIRVSDNGSGIVPEELPLAVASHATSKLTSADDLFSVRTLGFRGEALASIAEVSRFSVRSQSDLAESGAELEVIGGVASAVTPSGGARGTTIEVRNLFFNTPVRRKFMRSTQTEMGHISEAFTRLALAHPQVAFTLRHNGRPVHELPATDQLLQRITHFFGGDLADDLLWIESQDEQVRLSGYVARPNQSRSHTKMQYLFLNGRHIRDRALQHALGEAYRGLMLTGRYAITFLLLEMPAELVDVNVHPTKLEVRFQDGGRVYSQLLGALRTRFLTTDLTHRLSPLDGDGPAAGGSTADDSGDQAARRREELVAWAKGQTASWSPDDTASMAASAASPAGLAGGDWNALRQSSLPLATGSAGQGLRLNELPESFGWGARTESDGQTNRAASPLDPLAAEAAQGQLQATAQATGLVSPGAAAVAQASTALGRPPEAKALQVHNKYLVVENEQGLEIIDQHALHERILYEQFRTKTLAGPLESQQLLVPEPVDLAPEEAALAMEHQETLAQLGVRVERFGGDTLLVQSMPAMLRRLGPQELLRALLESMAQGRRAPDRRDLLDELLHMMSCKAAIKAGDPLTQPEIDALLASRHLAQDAHHCPHGRPTALVFTRDELDKQFKRT